MLRATDMIYSIESFDTLLGLQERAIPSTNDENWEEINANVNTWSGTNPLAIDREINDLINR